MLKLAIKTQKAFSEHKVVAEGSKDEIKIVCKVYKAKERAKIGKEFQEIIDDTMVTHWRHQLENLKTKASTSLAVISDEELRVEHDRLINLINNYSDEQNEKLNTFYKTHVIAIKDAKLVVEDENGNELDLPIPDTRLAEPVESLWGTSDECLAVLLDTYLDYVPFRDSLQKVITSAVFNLDYKDLEAKN